MSPAGTTTIDALPGPRSLPLIGNLGQLDLGRLHLELERWAEVYGPVYKVRFGRRTCVVIGDRDMIRDVLKHRPDQFRRQSSMQSVAAELDIDGLFTAEGAAWRRQRKLMNAVFAPRQVRASFDSVHTVTGRLATLWAEAADAGRPVDALADLRRYAVDVTTILAFGRDVDTLRRGPAEFRKLIEHVFPIFHRRTLSLVPYWRYFKLPSDRALDRGLAQLRAEVGRQLDEARERLATDPGREGAGSGRARDLLEAMLVARDADDSAARLDEADIFANAMTILFAGEDTTSNTAAWMLHHVATQPEVQQRLRAEVEGALGRELAGDLDALERLPYLDGVVQESLRLRSAAPLMFLESIGRQRVGDLEVPDQSFLLLLTRKVAIDPERFDEPARFDPSRWIDAERPPDRAHDPKAMLAFGYGPRLCPGRALAFVELRSIAAMAVQQFEIAPHGDAQVPEVYGFTMSPARVELRLERRAGPCPNPSDV